MSRVGKAPVTVPQGVEVKLNGGEVAVKGKLGELKLALAEEVALEINADNVVVLPQSETQQARRMWATTRALINNMVQGVSEGFTKKMEINGVGYRASLQGQVLVLQLGFSHDVRFPVPQGIKIECPSQTEIIITGFDKQQVGQVASEIRGYRPPEPYKGKGVKYADEIIVRKEGKKK